MTGAFSHQIIYFGIISCSGWLATLGAALVGFMTIWGVYPSFKPLIGKRPFAVFAASCSSFGIACVSIAVNLPGVLSSLEVIGDLASGLGMACSIALLAESVSSLDARRDYENVMYVAVSIAVLLYLLLLNVPLPLLVPACIAAPIASNALLFKRCSIKPRKGVSEGPCASNETGTSLRNAGAAMRLYTSFFIFLALEQGFSIANNDGYRANGEWDSVFGNAIFSVIMVILLLRLPKKKVGARLGILVLPTLIILIALARQFVESGGIVSGTLQYLSSFLFVLYAFTEVGALDLGLKDRSLVAGLIVGGLLTGAIIKTAVPDPFWTAVIAAWAVLATSLLVACVLRIDEGLYRFRPSSDPPAEPCIDSPAPSISANETEYLRTVSDGCSAIGQRHALSAREMEILGLLVRGRSAQSIAKEKHISYYTAKTHISNIYHKLGVHNRNELSLLFEREDKD